MGLRSIGASEELAEEISEARAPAAPAIIEAVKIEMHVVGRHVVLPAARRWRARTRRIETELVVDLPLFRVGKNFVSFLDLFELLFRGLVTRI